MGSAAVFDFDFTPTRLTRSSIAASGTFTTDDAPVVSNVLSVSGTVNGLQITGLDGDGFNIYLTESNAVSFSFFDGSGVSYVLNTGSNGADMAMSSANRSSRGTLQITPDTSTSPPSPVPVPASAPLFGAALLGLAGAGYAARRRKTAAAT